MTQLLRFILPLLFLTQADAGTVYRDRLVPAGAPCMVDFASRSINATMIKEVYLGDFTYNNFKVWGPNEKVTYRALRVVMIAGSDYEVTDGNLDRIKTGLMSQIADCRK